MSAEQIVPEHDVMLFLGDVDGAVTTDDLVVAASRAGAPPDVLRRLAQLPVQRWRSVDDAVAAIGSGWPEAPPTGRIVDPVDDVYD